ncbi:DUF3052 domain-containing protein [uncultured Polaribacter sp.]|uniref:DUF3052 domain-containing protein n=1 Tax=uncultured Polaribacter sp. TaxID=174711 RepID=UPI002613BF1B|nr:DUF3052 domain-containing protein [uncultured Polaribacter sp.]
MKTAGYSGTPLAKKLGIKQGCSVLVLNAPKPYLEFFYEFPSDIKINNMPSGNEKVDFIHLFVTTWNELKEYYPTAKDHLEMNGILWISWPKKTSILKSELGKFDIINYGLDNGLVDVKVAAIDDDWSGHKFVYRLKDRT